VAWRAFHRRNQARRINVNKHLQRRNGIFALIGSVWLWRSQQLNASNLSGVMAVTWRKWLTT